MIPAPENKHVVSSELESTFLLIEQIRAGDKSALDRLLRRFLPLLTRWASGRLPRGVRDLSDTEDLVQETIISALRHIDHIEIRGEGALQAYLRRAVLNRIRDELRRHGRRGLVETLDENVRAKEDSPLEIAIGNEALERYEAALVASQRRRSRGRDCPHRAGTDATPRLPRPLANRAPRRHAWPSTARWRGWRGS